MNDAPLPESGSWSVEQLVEAVEHLSPAEQREFERCLAGRQAANGRPEPDEATLIQAAEARLPAEDERRLRRLIARSECDQLTPHGEIALRLDQPLLSALQFGAVRCLQQGGEPALEDFNTTDNRNGNVIARLSYSLQDASVIAEEQRENVRVENNHELSSVLG